MPGGAQTAGPCPCSGQRAAGTKRTPPRYARGKCPGDKGGSVSWVGPLGGHPGPGDPPSFIPYLPAQRWSPLGRPTGSPQLCLWVSPQHGCRGAPRDASRTHTGRLSAPSAAALGSRPHRLQGWCQDPVRSTSLRRPAPVDRATFHGVGVGPTARPPSDRDLGHSSGAKACPGVVRACREAGSAAGQDPGPPGPDTPRPVRGAGRRGGGGTHGRE